MDFQQTDDANPLGLIQACSAVAVGTTPGGVLCVHGGTAGATPIQVTIAASSAQALVMMAMRPRFGRWQLGNHTMRLNVTTQNTNISWRRLYVCRVSAGGTSLATLASNLTVNTSVGTTGVKTATAAQAADAIADPTDYVHMVLTFQNSAGTAQSFQFTPNQLITTPFRKPDYSLYDVPHLPGILETALGVNLV